MTKSLILFSITVCLLAFVSNASAGLVAHYEFDSNFSDSSGNNNHGNGFGSPLLVPGAPLGLNADGAIQLNGLGDYIEIPNSESLNITGNEITLASWVYFDDVGGPPEIVISKGADNSVHKSPYFLYGMHILTGGTARFWLTLEGNVRVNVTSASPLESGIWYHLAGVYDGSDITLYVNGEASNAKGVGGGNITGLDTVLRLGTNGGLTEQMAGRIDDVRIYSHALSVEEIAAIVPEPATIGLLGLGGLAMLGIRRKR